MDSKNWHALTIKQVFEALGSGSEGLSDIEVTTRLAKYGSNTLPKEKKLSALILLASQFKNPLIYLLFLASAVSLFINHLLDGLVILTIILISTVVGFIQEYKASESLSKLIELIKYNVIVMRGGIKQNILYENIVPGDIIFLAPGDKIPADARILDENNLEIIEAVLTGESVPSTKSLQTLPPDTSIVEQKNMVFAGTLVASGTAKAIVCDTGIKSELGRIALLVKEVKERPTPLQAQISRLAKTLGLVVICVTGLVFILGILTGKSLLDMFLTSVAVVVAALPEGLLPAMTVILSIGMQRLAKRQGLVRKMLAAETLGSVTVICSDKTGTLTRGEMRVSEIVTEQSKLSHNGKKFINILGPDGETTHITALKIGALCNNATIQNPEAELEEWKVTGDSTEVALVLAAKEAGLWQNISQNKYPRLAELPFDAKYKLMATLNEDAENRNKDNLVAVKGAPEAILDRSVLVESSGQNLKLNQANKQKILEHYQELSSSGLRVLAIAYKFRPAKESAKINLEDIDNLIFVGLVGLKDPLRLEAKSALETARNAGIKLYIITGDSKFTTLAIAREIGLAFDEKSVLEGRDIDNLNDDALRKKLGEIFIFARVEPRHKIRIVEALQSKGEVVGMTGDGINDTPALKRADIGIAVGSGTDVAKEAADLVLLDNNFKTIVEAIKGGRIIFDNIKKVLLYLLTDAFSELVLIGSAVILSLPLPVLPIQILWIKMIEDTSPALALSFDSIDEGVMKRRPRKIDTSIISPAARNLIIFYAIIMDSALFGMFYYFYRTSGDIDYARTITFAGLGVTSLFYIYSIRGLKTSIFKINPFSNIFLPIATIVGVFLLLLAIYLPFLNKIMKTVPLGITEWSVLAGFAILSIVVYEIGKMFTLKRE